MLNETVQSPPLPHTPGTEPERDTGTAERVLEHIGGAHTRNASKKAARKAQAEAENRTRTSAFAAFHTLLAGRGRWRACRRSASPLMPLPPLHGG
ncbi:hypothetical protein AALB52_08405 [Lachnospiraceae bacterium 38-14]